MADQRSANILDDCSPGESLEIQTVEVAVLLFVRVSSHYHDFVFALDHTAEISSFSRSLSLTLDHFYTNIDQFFFFLDKLHFLVHLLFFYAIFAKFLKIVHKHFDSRRF